ncbi:MAG: App1 family protein [Granulosicoccus sp.]
MNTPPPTEEPGWEKLVHQLGIRAENAVDLVRERFRHRIVPDKPIKIIPFHGMGNDTSCLLRGRVLEYPQKPADDAESIWRNLQDSYRRFETDEIPDITVCLTVGDQRYHVQTDDEGYFLFEFPKPPEHTGHRLSVSLSLPDHPEQHDDTAGYIFFAPSAAAFGVISDIDDTVLVTQATSMIKMMRLTLLESSESRVPFSGVATFYKALHDATNPFFYVSSSPWNLFEFLDDFMHLNDITTGPLLLRDFGIDKTKLVAGPHKRHKLAQIRTVLEFYPDLRFILIGDSGQHDPEIYSLVVEEFPDRILCIYIRDVGHAARDRQVQALATQLQARHVDMLLVPDTLAAATHAASKGYIATHLPDLIAEELSVKI